MNAVEHVQRRIETKALMGLSGKQDQSTLCQSQICSEINSWDSVKLCFSSQVEPAHAKGA